MATALADLVGGRRVEASDADYSLRMGSEGRGRRELPSLFEDRCVVARSRDVRCVVHRLLQLLALDARPGTVVFDTYLVSRGSTGVMVTVDLTGEARVAEAELMRAGFTMTHGRLGLKSGSGQPVVDLNPMVPHAVPDAPRSRVATGEVRLVGLVHGGADDAEGTRVSSVLASLSPVTDGRPSVQSEVDRAMAVANLPARRLDGRSLRGVIDELGL